MMQKPYLAVTVPRIVYLLTVCFFFSSHACAQTFSPGMGQGMHLLEKRYSRASAILDATVLRTDFEAPSPNVPVRKLLMTLSIRNPFKGDLAKGDTVQILVGGKTMYEGKLYQVGETDLLPGTRAIFFLQYLFAEERDFSAGAPYFMDVVMTVASDSVWTPSPNSQRIPVSQLHQIFRDFAGLYDLQTIISSSDAVIKARIKSLREAGFRNGKYTAFLQLDSIICLQGSPMDDTLSLVFTDDYRRIHYRNRKKTDIPFYISKDKTALSAENRTNYFLSAGEKYVFLLSRDSENFRFGCGYPGIFETDRSGKIWNRSISVSPTILDPNSESAP